MTEGARCSKKLRAENERILFFFSSQNEKGKESKGSVAEDGTKHSKKQFLQFLQSENKDSRKLAECNCFYPSFVKNRHQIESSFRLKNSFKKRKTAILVTEMNI